MPLAEITPKNLQSPATDHADELVMPLPIQINPANITSPGTQSNALQNVTTASQGSSGKMRYNLKYVETSLNT